MWEAILYKGVCSGQPSGFLYYNMIIRIKMPPLPPPKPTHGGYKWNPAFIACDMEIAGWNKLNLTIENKNNSGLFSFIFTMSTVFVTRVTRRVVCRWFSPGTQVASTNKTDDHWYNWNIVESGVKHHNRKPSLFLFYYYLLIIVVFSHSYSRCQLCL
jgi:hypothetical protein